MSHFANAAGQVIGNSGGINLNTFNGGSNVISMAFWIKLAVGGGRNPQVSLSNTAGSIAGTASTTGSAVHAGIYDGSVYKNRGVAASPPEDVWMLLAFTWPSKNGPGYIAWVNKNSYSNDLGNSSGTIGTMPTFINARVNDLAGYIAEIGIWNGYVLTQEDIDHMVDDRWAPDKVAVANLSHHWSLKHDHQDGGRNDRKGSANLSIVAGSANADHPSGIVYGVPSATVTVNDQFGLNESTVVTGALTSKYAKVRLVDETGAPLLNLSNIRAMFFDTVDPFNEPTLPSVVTKTAFTNGTNGEMLVDVGASSLALTQWGFLTCTTSDGDPAQSPPARGYQYVVQVTPN